VIENNQELIDWLAAKIDAEKAKTNGHAKNRPATVAGLSSTDEQALEKCRAAKDAARFSGLFDYGDMSANNNNPSDTDYALLGKLKFWTQDPDQLDRLMRLSALRRPKWDENRAGRTWLRYSIDNVLREVEKTYDWGRSRPLGEYNHHPTPPHTPDDDYIQKEPEIVWFHKLGKPKPRRFVIEKVARKGYPLVIYGAGGVAKSFAALSGGIAMAGGHPDWLGLRVLEHGHVLYLDFELDIDEQHARVEELCNGLGVEVPKRLAYLSGRGMDRSDAFAKAHAFAEEYKTVAVIVDSVGQAITGDMDKNSAVNEFYRRHIEPFSLYGTTPILVDHEGKRQQGEKHKDKSVIGGSYKTNNARGVLQFILEAYDKEEHRLDIRVRVPKINFEPPDPFGISITFGGDSVAIETRMLPDEELLDEEREPLDKRVYAALATEPLSVIDLVRITGAVEGSVRNTLSRLMRENRVESTTARPKLYYRIDGPSPDGDEPKGPPEGEDFVTRERGENPTPEYNHHQPSLGGDGDDYIRERAQAPTKQNKGAQAEKAELQGSPPTVAEFFANPPSWLPGQLEKYRENHELYFESLCAAVEAAMEDEGSHVEDVKEEVRQELRKLGEEVPKRGER
jgi:hypothetical protein